MKRILKLGLCVLLVFGMIPSFKAANNNTGGKLPMLTGLFVAPELITGSNGWNQEDWNTVMSQLKAVGINKVVIQYSAQYYSDTSKNYYYTPSFEKVGADNTGKQNQIPYALKAAKDSGVKIWLGLHIAESAWFSAMSAGFQDTAFLKSSAEYSQKIFDDLWKQFKGTYADTIEGWYLPYEFNNIEVKGQAKTKLINNFYKPLTSHMKSVTPDKQIMVSPLVYASLTVAPSDSAVDVWRQLCRDLWADTRVDIIAPQDGCGWESTMKETLDPWYKAMDEARKQAQPTRDMKKYGKAVAWNNPECYNMNGTGTMTIKRLIDNMSIINQYVSEHVSFSLHSLAYLAEGKNGVQLNNRHYYQAYEYAMKNGKLFVPSKALPAPSNVKAQITNGVDVSLSWNKVTDDKVKMPVAGYDVWRKETGASPETAIRIKEIPQPKDDSVTVIDYQADPGTQYDYMVYAFDGTGNRSGTPATVQVEVESYGIALNREFGDNLAPSMTIIADGYLNTKLMYGKVSQLNDSQYGTKITNWENGKGAWVGFEKTDKNKLGKYNIQIANGTGKKIGFLYLNILNQPTRDVYLPEKIDVLADGVQIAVVYPFKEYQQSPVGEIWVPVDLKDAVTAKTITLRVTQKYYRSMVSEIRVYEGKPTASAGNDYKEPENLVAGQLVMISGYNSTQNFSPDNHFRGVKAATIDTQKGTLETNYMLYKGNYATRLLTHGLSKGPELRWTDDSSNSVWLGITNLGSSFELSVDLKSPSTVRAIETQWLLDRDATVFLPNMIEFYGQTVTGETELISKAYRPSAAMLNFDEKPSATNTHRIETKSFRAICNSDTVYKKIIAKVFPQYPANTHFARNLVVY